MAPNSTLQQAVCALVEWARLHPLVNLPLTPGDRAGLRGPLAEDPRAGLGPLAYKSSAATVERGGLLVVWTVLAADGGVAGDVLRHYPRRGGGT